MDNKLIGEQITRYRKEQNLTQEELGRAVGVSTQAVSRWENGGAPDVALLPAIADKLGVTIDALFGREGGERGDIHQILPRWLTAFPDKERFDQLCRLNWTAGKSMLADKANIPELGYMEKCMVTDGAFEPGAEVQGKGQLATCQVWFEGGFMLDLHAEDLSFATVWPRPEAGYEAFFLPRDQYRRLFALLARPGCLELLEYLNSRSYRLYLPVSIGKVLGIDAGEVEAILRELKELGVVRTEKLQVEEGLTEAYAMLTGVTLVPFLYMARCMMQYGMNMFSLGGSDMGPLLKGGEWENEKEKKDEKK